MKQKSIFSYIIILIFLILAICNIVIFKVDFHEFKPGPTFGWNGTTRFNIFNDLFIGYCGIILLFSTIWPKACTLFEKITAPNSIDHKKRKRSVAIWGLLFLGLALISVIK